MKKRYILNGFDSRKLAQLRNHELAIKSGIGEDASTKYLFRVHCLVKEQWGLEITEDYLSLLDDNERSASRLKEIPPQIFVQAYIPMLFRYLDEEYVDEFISEGKLRLSSFKKFHEHKDEHRGDKEEGRNMVTGIAADKQMTTIVSHGSDAFVLSTSLILNQEVQNDFEATSGFIVENPSAFIDAITKEIPEFKGINYGPCLYQSNHIIKRSLHDFDFDQLHDEDDPTKMSFDKMMQASSHAGGLDVLFLKTLEYSPQHEYRILWHSYLEEIPEHIEIISKEAASYCRKMDVFKDD